MKRAERNEYNYIKRYEKQFDLSYGTTLTIQARTARPLHRLGFPPRKRQGGPRDVR